MVEYFSGSIVRLCCDLIQAFAGVDSQIGSLGEILSEQPVGIFIRTALPGAGAVTEIDWYTGGGGEFVVQCHFDALIPSQ